MKMQKLYILSFLILVVHGASTLCGTKLYVGNLPYRITEDSLEKAFAQFGVVKSAQIIMDRDTGRSKRFGFVEMATSDEAQKAIAGLDGQELEGRNIKVNETQERSAGPGGKGGSARGGKGGQY
jgi:RNA recognition motif-containing protein